jgi:hypothetical protein
MVVSPFKVGWLEELRLTEGKPQSVEEGRKGYGDLVGGGGKVL